MYRAVELCHTQLSNTADLDDAERNLEHIKNKVRECTKKPIEYFKDRIFDKLKEDVAVYKVLRYANAYYLQENFKRVADSFVQDVEGLKQFSASQIDRAFNDLAVLRRLLIEEGAQFENEPTPNEQMLYSQQFFEAKLQKILGYSVFLRLAFTVAPSSAAVERVFSILNRCFGNQQRWLWRITWKGALCCSTISEISIQDVCVKQWLRIALIRIVFIS
jgi:hypothetical protein